MGRLRDVDRMPSEVPARGLGYTRCVPTMYLSEPERAERQIHLAEPSRRSRRYALGRPGATAIGDLDPDGAAPSDHRYGDRLLGIARPAAVPQSARQRHPRTGAPGRAPRPRTRGRPAPALAVRQPSRFPEPRLRSSHTTPFRPPALPERPQVRVRTHRDARSPPPCTSSRSTPYHCPSVAVRETADGAHRP
jgi:hypothetical protein